MKSDYSKDEITKSSVRLDPKNSRYTIPRSYGVYQLSGSKRGTKFFRYGNHPIRMKELQREFGSVTHVALYKSRDSAIQRATHENATQ